MTVVDGSEIAAGVKKKENVQLSCLGILFRFDSKADSSVKTRRGDGWGRNDKNYLGEN